MHTFLQLSRNGNLPLPVAASQSSDWQSKLDCFPQKLSLYPGSLLPLFQSELLPAVLLSYLSLLFGRPWNLPSYSHYPDSLVLLDSLVFLDSPMFLDFPVYLGSPVFLDFPVYLGSPVFLGSLVFLDSPVLPDFPESLSSLLHAHQSLD